MLKIKDNKKAEMSSKMLITIILLVIGFGILLIVYSNLNGIQEVDRQACHESIVFRSTFNAGPFEVGKATIPLKCRTEKICLSMSGDDCPGMAPGKKNPVTEIELSNDKEEAKREILETIANAMYDCNSMLGEGKLDFMPHKFTEKNYCLICSRIVFDEEARKEVKEVGYGELYQYLEKKKTPEGKSYLSHIYPGWVDWEASKTIFEKKQEKSEDGNFKKLKFEDWKIDLEYEGGYAIIAMMTPESTWNEVVGSILIPVGSLLVLSGIGAPVGVGMITTGALAGGAIFMYNFPGGKYLYSPPTLTDYNADNLKDLECSSFETAP